MKCPKCRKIIYGEANYCHFCGCKISEPNAQTNTVRFICKGCNSVMHISTDNPIVNCPCCGSSELIIEGDDVTIARIKAKTVLEYQKNERELEIEKLYYDEQREERREKKEKKSWKLLLSCIGILWLFILGYMFIPKMVARVSGKIPFPLTSYECEEEPYTTIQLYITDAGFTNVQSKALNDLDSDEMELNGLVYKIMVNGNPDVWSETMAHLDDPVIIYYHSPKINDK